MIHPIAGNHRSRIARLGGCTLCALALMLLNGCASVPVPDLKTPLPAHWRNEPASVVAKAPNLHSWWRVFADPRLNALIKQSLQSNLDVAQAVQHLRASRALYEHADASFLPSLNLHTDDPVDPDASASFFTVGFDSLWEFGLFGRRQAVQDVARGRLDDAVASLQQARVSLVAEVVRDWIDLRNAQQRLRIRTRMLDTRKKNLQRLTLRIHLKLTAPDKLDRAQADVAEAQAALSQPRQDENAAAQRLALLLGRSEPESAWSKPGALPRLGVLSITAAPANLLRTRPGIARAEARVIQDAGKLGIARANLYPDIGLGGSLLWSTSTLTHRDAPTNRIASIGPVIDIPLFDWGLREARKHASDHQLKASVLAYRKAVLAGVAEVETALGNLAQQRAREHASHDALMALKKAAHNQAVRERLGLSDAIERGNSEIARDQSELALIKARTARDIAYVALYKALGGAPDPDIIAVRSASTESPR